MGIQINGQTDTVSSTTSGGKVTITPFNGNVGTGASISSPATNVLTLGTNNTESVRINSSGNIGINSTSPRSKLDVGGELILGRQDSSQEGGQISLCRSSDNASTWSIDAYGSTSTPSIRFVDNIAGASRMEIDGSGRVTMPYQPFVFVTRSGDVSYTSGTKIPYDTVVDSRGLTWSTSNNNFVVPATGVYTFSIYLRLNITNAGYFYFQIRSNGSALYSANYLYLGKPNTSDTFQTVGLPISVKLTQNDTADVVAFHTGTSPSTILANQTLMSIVFNG